MGSGGMGSGGTGGGRPDPEKPFADDRNKQALDDLLAQAKVQPPSAAPSGK